MTLTRNFFRRTYVATFTLLMLNICVFSTNALSEEQANSILGKIYLAHINSYYSINGFYNFSANQGDQKHLAVINEASDKIDELIQSIKEDIADKADSESFINVENTWTSYRKVLDQNIEEVTNTGYPDLRLAGDMATANINLNGALSSLYTEIAADSANKFDKLTELSHKANINLALMMTKYSARTTSTVSQVYSGGDTEITIDALATSFEASLKELTAQAKSNKEALDFLDSATTKWDFIKPSYINYNENRVNFIVNLYSKKIIDNIDSAMTTRE